MTIDRIMIIGGPGAGKSWLAARLAASMGLPVIAIDDLVHGSDGQVRPAQEIDRDAIAASEGAGWIIEGGNSRTYEHRRRRAQCIIRLRPPRLVRLWRVVRRPGVTVALLRWTWAYDRIFGPKDAAVTTSAEGKLVFDVTSPAGIATVLSKLPCPSGTTPSPISKADFPV